VDLRSEASIVGGEAWMVAAELSRADLLVDDNRLGLFGGRVVRRGEARQRPDRRQDADGNHQQAARKRRPLELITGNLVGVAWPQQGECVTRSKCGPKGKHKQSEEILTEDHGDTSL
jgi:hypothetical protein